MGSFEQTTTGNYTVKTICVFVRGGSRLLQRRVDGSIKHVGRKRGPAPHKYEDRCICGPANFDCVNCYLRRVKASR